MKPDKWLQPHCAVEMGSLFPLTTSSGGPRADHGREQVAGGEIETGGLTRSGPLRKTGQRVQVNGFDWDAPHRAPRSISWTEQWHFGAGSHNRCGSRSSEHIQKRQRHPPPSRSVNLNSLPCSGAGEADMPPPAALLWAVAH